MQPLSPSTLFDQMNPVPLSTLQLSLPGEKRLKADFFCAQGVYKDKSYKAQICMPCLRHMASLSLLKVGKLI